MKKEKPLAISFIEKYPRCTLYQVYKKIDKVYKPLYKTTLKPHELKDYEVIEMYE